MNENISAITNFVNQTWDESIIPTLKEYIHIPNKSPYFDKQWREHGYMDKAAKLIADWCKKQKLKNLHVEIIQLENRTPIIYMEIPGESNETILMYGHMDKQPEMTGWESDLAPWKAVLRDDKLYGRGAADDGYAAFASLTAIHALQKENIPHARCVILIEACEESGSYDLPFYINTLINRIGQPNLVICLDSGCGNYDQMWVTTSLRGLVGGELHIDVLKEGIHSGLGSGIVPSCFLVLRQLLNEIEDIKTSEIILNELKVEIPPERLQQANKAGDVLGNKLWETYPFEKGVRPVSNDPRQLIMNRTWKAALSITGDEGIPELPDAGNVTLPSLIFKLSMRTPPTCDARAAGNAMKKVFETDTPFNANVKFDVEEVSNGWNAPAQSEWLTKAINNASERFFGKEAMYMGEGGSIPFMGMLGQMFPKAQFVITGVLGPASNAHGPNEFLHIPTGKKITCCIASIVAEHFQRSGN